MWGNPQAGQTLKKNPTIEGLADNQLGAFMEAMAK